MNFSDYSKKTSSVKEVFCHVEPAQKLNVWAIDSGSVYKKTVSHFTLSVSEGVAPLIEGSSSALNQGEFYYNTVTGVLYVHTFRVSCIPKNNRFFLVGLPTD